MATVKLGPKFFIKERNSLYSNWPTACCREFFQNSLDANSRRIDISIKPIFGVGCILSFDDNGNGMTPQVLEDVFFALGETTKNDGSTVGGFGRARILTCFAMDSYEIRTGNSFVKGVGAEYNIESVPEFVSGCKFKVVIPDKTADEMISAMNDVLAKSQMSCQVYLNGQFWNRWTYRRSVTRTLSCGNVHVNKSNNSNGKIIVRVNGLWTFDLWTSCPYQVIVEIDPKNSRNILTVSRDNLHYKYQQEIEKWLQEIAVDRRSALRETNRKTRLIKNGGPLISRRNKSPLPVVAGSVAAFSPIPAAKPANTIVNESFKVPSLQVVRCEESFGYVSDLPSVYIEDDTENQKIRKVINNYDPLNWGTSTKFVRGEEQSYQKGSTYRKLLLAWQVACDHALEALMSYNGIEQVEWMLGWLFSDDAEACHIKISGTHALCLNPVNSEGKMKFGITSREDLLSLMALAKHEVAHISVDVHNEDFSAVHTEIDKRFDTSKVLRSIKERISSV